MPLAFFFFTHQSGQQPLVVERALREQGLHGAYQRLERGETVGVIDEKKGVRGETLKVRDEKKGCLLTCTNHNHIAHIIQHTAHSTVHSHTANSTVTQHTAQSIHTLSTIHWTHLHGRRVHEVEAHEVVDAHGLERRVGVGVWV